MLMLAVIFICLLSISIVSANEDTNADDLGVNDDSVSATIGMEDSETDLSNSVEEVEIEGEGDTVNSNPVSIKTDHYIDYDKRNVTVEIENLEYDSDADYNLTVSLYSEDILVFNQTHVVKNDTFSTKSPKFVLDVEGNQYNITFVLTKIPKAGEITTIEFKDWIIIETEDTYNARINEVFIDDIPVIITTPSTVFQYKANRYFKIIMKEGVVPYSPAENDEIIVKIWTGKTVKKYTVRTDSKGIAKISTKKLKIGTHKVKIEYFGTDYYQTKTINTKIVIKKKITPSTVTLKLKVNSKKYSKKKLKTKDILFASANSKKLKQAKGVTIGTKIDDSQKKQHSTKLIKAKVWFKNKKTGKIKIKIKTATKNQLNIKKISWIKGYVPYKAKVWYVKSNVEI